MSALYRLQIVSSTPDHAIGAYGNVAIHIWHIHTRKAALRHVEEMSRRAKAAGDGHFAYFGVIGPSAPMPEADVRAELARHMRDHSQHVVASANVFEGDGFRAAAVRNVVTGIGLIARQPFPHRVFKTTADSARWIEEQLRAANQSAPLWQDLDAAVAELRGAPHDPTA